MNLPITHGHGRPVPLRSRNPRRAYDVDGLEITPMTLQQAMDLGVMAVRAICACGHAEDVAILAGRWPSTSFVPDAGLTLRCSACGTPDPRTEPAWPKRAQNQDQLTSTAGRLRQRHHRAGCHLSPITFSTGDKLNLLPLRPESLSCRPKL